MRAADQVLDTLTQHGIADTAQCQTLAETRGALWIAVLQALAAWIAALCVVGMVFVLSREVYWQFGIVLVAAAMALFWHWRDGGASAAAAFQGQLALALSLAGQAVMVSGVLDRLHDNTSLLFSAVLALALSIPRTSTLHRVACLLLALWCGCINVAPYALGLLGLALSTVAVVLWFSRSHWAVSPRASYLTAVTHSATLAGLVVLFTWHGIVLFDVWRWSSERAVPGWFYAYPVGAALLWLACAAWLSRTASMRERVWLVGTALLVAVLGYGAPGLLVCLALVLATFHACARGWCGVTIVCAWGFLGLYYYSLNQTLLVKSATLAAVGVLLLVLGRVVERWRKNSGSTP